MTQPDDADSIEPWLSALRGNVEPAPPAMRRRTVQRLAQLGLVASGAASAMASGAVARPSLPGARWFSGALWLPVGIVVGASGHAWLAEPAEVATTLSRALPSLSAPAVPAAPPLPTPVEAAPALTAVLAPSVKARPAVSAREPQGLERELLLLEQARTRLSEGQAQVTLQLLREHHSQYPSSTLAQEREALAVKALMAAGRVREARQAAEAFVQRFPGSVLRASVERAVGTIP
jgi:hypothetical protein